MFYNWKRSIIYAHVLIIDDLKLTHVLRDINGWTSFLLVGRYVPTKVIRVRNKDKHWFDDQCRHAFGLKQEVHLRWTRDLSLDHGLNK